MKTLSVEEFRAHMDDYLDTTAPKEVVLTRDGKPCAVVRPLHAPDDNESATLAKSTDFWRMIRARREEKGIPWEEAKKDLQLDQ